MLFPVNVVATAVGKDTHMKGIQHRVLHYLGWRASSQPMSHGAEHVKGCYPESTWLNQLYVHFKT